MTVPKKLKRFLFIALGLVVLVGGASFILGATGQEQAMPGGELYTVAKRRLIETASASGTISPHVQVEVKSRGSGEVIEILVEEGDTVKAGDLLVRLDPADAKRAVENAKNALRGAQAQLAESRAGLKVAELELENANTTSRLNTRGVELGVVASDTARQTAQSKRIAEATVAQRKAQIGSMSTQIETARLAVDDAELRLKETNIFAPVDGTVLSLAVEKGSIVASAITNISGGTAVLTLADLSDLRVVGAIDEAQIGRVAPGQDVVIRVDAHPNRSFTGRVERVSPLGVEESSVVTFDVEIVITDERKDLLRSGMSADVEIVTAALEDALVVPLLAIESEGSERFVRMANGERRAIRTGATDGTHIQVLEGLAEGDQISLGGEAAPADKGGRGFFPMGRRR